MYASEVGPGDVGLRLTMDADQGHKAPGPRGDGQTREPWRLLRVFDVSSGGVSPDNKHALLTAQWVKRSREGSLENLAPPPCLFTAVSFTT
ncbi:hypothetical protein NDU88_006592 [Pleurodeles waltl]|uniref:Uncharacterized protein n=1 Tax=Pleurodeles waltl TaxID=8319 RepID=A0AAV7MMS2_PLEWA|nr:hypothetical protein NDU88_006592 [Pleurodeles waltl]